MLLRDLDDSRLRDLVVPALVLRVPDHPQVAEVDRDAGDDVAYVPGLDSLAWRIRTKVEVALAFLRHRGHRQRGAGADNPKVGAWQMVIPIRAGWRDKVESQPEWRGALQCEWDCSQGGKLDGMWTYHLGFKAKRQATLYGLPVAPIGDSSVGYISCERCGQGRWYKRDAYQQASRDAVANLAVLNQADNKRGGAPFRQLFDTNASGRAEWKGIMECPACGPQHNTLTLFVGFRVPTTVTEPTRPEAHVTGCIMCLRCDNGTWLTDADFVDWGSIAAGNRRKIDPDGLASDKTCWRKEQEDLRRAEAITESQRMIEKAKADSICPRCGGASAGVTLGDGPSYHTCSQCELKWGF